MAKNKNATKFTLKSPIGNLEVEIADKNALEDLDKLQELINLASELNIPLEGTTDDAIEALRVQLEESAFALLTEVSEEQWEKLEEEDYFWTEEAGFYYVENIK